MVKQFKPVYYFFLTQEICEQGGANTTHLGKRYAVIYSQRFMKLSCQQKIVPMFLHSWIYFEVNFLKLFRLYPKHIPTSEN
jgi:alpha-galactosidase